MKLGTRRLRRLEGRNLWDGRDGGADMVSEFCDADRLVAGRTLDCGQDLGYALSGGSGSDELSH